VPDWVYEWLIAFDRIMSQGSLSGALIGLALALLSSPLLIFAHELGHALAVKARRLPLHALGVGDRADVILTVGGFRIELGRLFGHGDVGGYVLYDGHRSTPRDTLVIALAGPAANLAGALLTGWLAMRFAHAAPNIPFTLAMMTIGGLWMALANLRQSGEDPLTWSDGVWVRAAWRVLNRPGPLWRDPNDATSAAPPLSS
jgi:hypothetical protein